MFPGSSARVLLAWSPLLVLLGCSDLGDFGTDARASYYGEINGSDSDQGKSSFIREGFRSHTRMRLAFDPDAAARFVPEDEADAGGDGVPSPGVIDTFVCKPGVETCKTRDSAAAFEHARLEPIANLAHDALSQYDFPGGGRLRNYMFFARTTAKGDTPARAANVFISLMDGGTIEVRVIAPSVIGADGETQAPALFGVFVLERTES